MEVRTFRNSDPPLLCEIWRKHQQLRGKYQGISPSVLERIVFSKPYFNPQGVWLAFEGDVPVGFAHAGFGVAENQSELDKRQGLIAQLMLVDHGSIDQVAGELIRTAENYLIQRGAESIVFGGRFPFAPFYLGIYGGSRAVGVLADDQRVNQALATAGYEQTDSIIINHWRLGDFRQLVDRQQRQIGRDFVLENVSDSFQQTWLQACHYDVVHQKTFQLKERRTQEAVGQLAFWEMDPLIENWGVSGLGLVALEVKPAWRRKGLATYMVGESLRQLKQLGIALVEIQHPASDSTVASLCRKLGFSQVDSLRTWHKSL